MQDTTSSVSVAKVALLSSLLTLFILSGIFFLARGHITSYLVHELRTVPTEIAVPEPENIEPLVNMNQW